MRFCERHRWAGLGARRLNKLKTTQEEVGRVGIDRALRFLALELALALAPHGMDSDFSWLSLSLALAKVVVVDVAIVVVLALALAFGKGRMTAIRTVTSYVVASAVVAADGAAGHGYCSKRWASLQVR